MLSPVVIGLAVVGLFAVLAGVVCWLLEREFRQWEAFWGEDNAD